MTDNTIPEAVVNAACEAAWPEFRSHLEGQQAWIDADPLRQNRLRLIVIQALAAAQKQRQLNVGAPRTPEQIAATVAWVQSLADSDSTPQPEQQDGVEAWDRERIEAVASRVERAGDKEAAVLIRDLLEAGIEAEQERIDIAPQTAPVGVEASYHPCTSILIEGLKRLEGGSDVLAEWDRARAKADTALAQQPDAWITPGGDVSRSFHWCLERCLPGQYPRPLYAAQQSAAVDAEVWLFKGTDGEWRTFHNEQHMLDTIADGRWEVRKFYACTPPVVWEEGE